MRNVLILGCGRSGTSIFGELFESIPGYQYLSEPQLSAIPPASAGLLAVKVPIASEPGPPPVGLPATAGDLYAAVPEPRRVFWVVRHPLDAICSLRVGIADGWGHHPRPPDWLAWRDRPLVERCAHHWATINGPGFDQVRDDVVIQTFESLIADPERAARAVADACEVPMTREVEARLSQWADRVQDTDNDRFVEARTSRRRSRADHRVRVGRWRENLTDEEIDQIRPIIEAVAERFGYDLPDSPVSRSLQPRL